MNKEIEEILDYLKNKDNDIKGINFLKYQELTRGQINLLLDYITNLQQIEQDHKEANATLMSELAKLEEENKIKDTNWESLKYYLEKLYYKDYIEEAISDDIDKKIQELESKVEIKDYQKEIKALQQEKNNLYLDNTMLKLEKDVYKQGYEELKELIEKVITEVKNNAF